MPFKMKSKSDRILTSVKLWFLLPLQCKITVFTAQKPSKKETKSLQKNTLQLDPPKIVSFPSRATLDGILNRKGFQKGPQNRASRAANFLWKSMIFSWLFLILARLQRDFFLLNLICNVLYTKIYRSWLINANVSICLVKKGDSPTFYI